jgi:hypothetical protein
MVMSSKHGLLGIIKGWLVHAGENDHVADQYRAATKDLQSESNDFQRDLKDFVQQSNDPLEDLIRNMRRDHRAPR